MSYAAIPWGERDGRMYLAHEVENGKRCGCLCPACRYPLVAANKGRKQAPHFRHAAAQSCEHGRSEGIRRAAVQLIAERNALLLPSYQKELRLAAKNGAVCSEQFGFSAMLIHADMVERFVGLDGVRAHALMTAQGRQYQRDDNRRPWQCWHDWRASRERDDAIRQALEYCGLEGEVLSLPSLPHYRQLQLRFQSGKQLTVQLDQGFSFWEAERNERPQLLKFDFAARQLGEEIMDRIRCRVTAVSDESTQLFISMVESNRV